MSFRACVLTVSTKGARGERKDESGEKLADLLVRLPAEVVGRALVTDDVAAIRQHVPGRHHTFHAQAPGFQPGLSKI